MPTKIKGILPVLHTPLNMDGQVDEMALRKIVEFLVSQDIGGIWVLGTGGEDMNLTIAQRKTVVRTAHSQNRGRKPLVVGTSFYSFEDSCDFLEFLNQFELNGVHYTPYQQLISLDRIKYCYFELAKTSKNPVWMYSSANWCQHIPPSFVREMKGTHNIVGMKYSTSNIAHLTEVASLADDEFNIISAVASTLVPSLTVGVDGATSSLAGAFPEPLIEIYKSFRRGDIRESMALQRKLNEFTSKWPKSLSKDNFLKAAEEKSILEYRGFCGRATSTYYRDATDEESKFIVDLFKEYYPNLSV